jgi:hypothetical protein
VNLSLYQAAEAPTASTQFVHITDGGKALSLTHLPVLRLRKVLGTDGVTDCDDPKAIGPLEVIS